MSRTILSVINPYREDAQDTATYVCEGLSKHQIEVTEDPTHPNIELMLVFGGDGTILGAAQTARELEIPLLGVNMGRMGFLAEAEVDSLDELITSIAKGAYEVEERMTLQVEIINAAGEITWDWALNEAAITHSDLAHPAHFGVGVDGHGVSTYGADGILVSTPTGSTAYSFSAGGPVIWPDTEAFLMVPLAAHGLFTRPLVLGPSTKLEISVLKDQRDHLQVYCDGVRHHLVEPGTKIICTKSDRPVKLARLNNTPFSARLVAKFNLPVAGWSNATSTANNAATDSAEKSAQTVPAQHLSSKEIRPVADNIALQKNSGES
ncbi:NAD kinase [Gleimia sp. 6138-11-ORH1]|nr:NAD kinase [Gleimia sp. 6138-11-ORH1]